MDRGTIVVAVDVVLFAMHEKTLNVLLVQRKHPPFEDMWAFPGGMVEANEGLVQAARRELAEETGVHDVPYLCQLAAFGDPERDPRGRVISIAYVGLLPSLVAVQGADDAARASWWPVDNVPSLAFDHERILSCACHRLRTMVESDVRLLFHLVPMPFVMSELRQAYESIMGRNIDKRNFRRLILRHQWVKPVGVRFHQGRGRPAREYVALPNALVPSPEDDCHYASRQGEKT